MGNHPYGWEQTIKGPGHRAKFDVRRVWECPHCRRQVRSGGHIVNRRCDCPAAAWMKLVEGPIPTPVSATTLAQVISEVSHVHGNMGQE